MPKRGSFLIISAFRIQVFFNLCFYIQHVINYEGLRSHDSNSGLINLSVATLLCEDKGEGREATA